MNIAAPAQGLIFTLLRAYLVLPLEKESQSVPLRNRLYFAGRKEWGERKGGDSRAFLNKWAFTKNVSRLAA